MTYIDGDYVVLYGCRDPIDKTDHVGYLKSKTSSFRDEAGRTVLPLQFADGKTVNIYWADTFGVQQEAALVTNAPANFPEIKKA